MPGGKVVLVMTRWHENDLAGHLLKQQEASPLADKWNVVRIPALNTAESAEQLTNARDALIEQGYYQKLTLNLNLVSLSGGHLTAKMDFAGQQRTLSVQKTTHPRLNLMHCTYKARHPRQAASFR
jgi:hypothetical protein